jgi:hypothetical protein
MSLLDVIVGLLIIGSVALVFALMVRIRRTHESILGLLPWIMVGFLLLALIFAGRLISNLVDVIILLGMILIVMLGLSLRRK